MNWVNGWTTVSEPRVRIHDMYPFGFLDKIKGLGAYASRALVLPGIVYSGFTSEQSRQNIWQNFAWLRDLNIGANELHLIPGDNLAAGILRQDEDLQHLHRIRRAVAKGMPVDFYLSRKMHAFVRALNIGWHNISTAHPQLAEKFDDKHYLRCLGTKLHSKDSFVPWEYVTCNYEQLMETRNRVLSMAADILPTEIVYAKVHNYDGGAGILRIDPKTSEEVIRGFAEEYKNQGLIVDAGYPSDAFEMYPRSVKIVYYEDHWEPLFFSNMYIQHDAHQGSEVAIGQHIVDLKVQEAALKATAALNDEIVKSGYGKDRPRTANMDFMDVRANGKIHTWILECNARSSASDYTMAVCHQARRRFGDKSAVVMHNLDNLPRNMSHNELMIYLNGQAWDGTNKPGFLLGNAGCIEYGKVTVFSVAKTIEEAREINENLIPAHKHPRRLAARA